MAEEDEIIYGGNGKDTIDGGSGDDTIYGGNGKDTIDGGSGDDIIDGGNGADTLSGGSGNDLILGGNGNDVIYGGEGDDTINGQLGFDIIDVGAGNDTIILEADNASDIVKTGEGFDNIILDFSSGNLGNDIIMDFELEKDRLFFIGVDSDMISLTEENGNTLLMIGDQTITLVGVTGVSSINELINRPPVIEAQSLLVDENSLTDISVGNVAAFDPDGNSLSYSLSGFGAENFEIDSSGHVKVASGANLDFEMKNSYALTVTVSDGIYSRSADLSIFINNVNEMPEFSAESYSFSVDENSAAQTVVGSISAKDPENDSLVYSLSGEGSENFAIDGGGNVTVALGANLDFEMKNSYALTVTGSDGLLIDSASLNIAINDVVENQAPIIASGPYEFDVNENAVGALVGSVSASDPDGDDLTYSLSGSGSSNFSIDSSGNISVKADGSLNFEEQDTYNLSVEVSDGLATVTAPVTVNVIDQNENPVISTTVLDVDENIMRGSVIGTLAAFDPEGGALTYEIISTGVIGGDDAYFEIDPVTGEISLAESYLTVVPAQPFPILQFVPTFLDYEVQNQYNLDVQVTDKSGFATSSSLVINIQDLEDQFFPANELNVNTEQRGLFLSNDFLLDAIGGEVDVSSLSVVSSGGAIYGTVIMREGEGVLYSPNDGYIGFDSFTYTVSDGTGASAQNTVNVEITSSQPPTVDNESFNRGPEPYSSVIIPKSTLLEGDLDPQGDPLFVRVASQPKYGTLSDDGNGNIVYTPDNSLLYFGSDSFVYEAVDPNGNFAQAVVTIAGYDTIAVAYINDGVSGFNDLTDLVTLQIFDSDYSGGLNEGDLILYGSFPMTPFIDANLFGNVFDSQNFEVFSLEYVSSVLSDTQEEKVFTSESGRDVLIRDNGLRESLQIDTTGDVIGIIDGVEVLFLNESDDVVIYENLNALGLPEVFALSSPSGDANDDNFLDVDIFL